MTRPEMKQLAKEKLRGNWGNIIIALLLFALITSAASSLLGIIQLIIAGPMAVGLAAVFLNLFRKGKTDVEDLFVGFKNFANNFITGLLVQLFICLWSLLFVIPGIVKSYAYAMTFYIQHDHPEMNETDAITASRNMMKGHKADLFFLDLSFIGWYLLVGLTFGILAFYVVPYHRATRTAFYENLKAQQEGGNAAEETAAEETVVEETDAPQEEAQAEETAEEIPAIDEPVFTDEQAEKPIEGDGDVE